MKERFPNWNLLTDLEGYMPASELSEDIQKDIDAIRSGRLLFHEPDLIKPLLDKVTIFLKELLNAEKKKFLDVYQKNMDELQTNDYFNELTPEQKRKMLQKYQLLSKPEVNELDGRGVNNELKNNSLEQWATKIAALPEQFRSALEEAMKLAVPEAKSYRMPKQTISTIDELASYLSKVKQGIEELLDSGNSVILK